VYAFDGQPKDVVQFIGIGTVFFAEIQAGGSLRGGRVHGIAFVERHARLFGLVWRRVGGCLKCGRHGTRGGVELDRSTLADWVGQTARLMRPLVDVVGAHVMAADRVHADDTTVPVLEPGLGKTSTGRFTVTGAIGGRRVQRTRIGVPICLKTGEASW